MRLDHLPRGVARRKVGVLMALALVMAVAATMGLVAQDLRVTKANYDLAAKWTAAKVGKMVFDTSVQAHWLETGDRFWYSWETSQGKKHLLIDPLKKVRAPLFDNAKMAAMLTTITRTPYDAQHLPITNLKFVKKDTALQFEVELPKDAEVAATGKVEEKKEQQVEKKEQQIEKKEQQVEKEQQIEKKDEKIDQKTETEKKAEAEKKTKTLYFEYDLAIGKLTLLEGFTPPPKKAKWASISPDEKCVVFARGHNLHFMEAESYKLAQKAAEDPKIVETKLTTDGDEYYSYERRLSEDEKEEWAKDEKDLKDKKTPPRRPAVTINWSKDSQKFALVRADSRKVADLWVINSLANPRPKLESYRYSMPGEANIPQNEMHVFDIASKKQVKVKTERFKDQTLGIFTSRVSNLQREQEKTEPRWVADTSDKLYFSRTSRDLHRIDVCLANPETGEVKTLIEERLNTYVDIKPLRLLANGKELIHWSERDGWGHYYLFDENGALKNQITSGEFFCDAIEYIDEKARTIWVTVNGREAGEDPYFTHLYRVSLDGTGMKLLNPGDASHATGMADSGRYFVDTSSRVNTAPKAVLYDALGTQMLELETTDVSALLDVGFRYPEPFKVKADDGVTELHGVMYRPFDLDPAKKYPIIAFVYPGPQTESVTKTFSPRHANVMLAQFGFIVIEVGNRGGHPNRSKWYHNYGYGNLRDYGLADKKAAIEQLARRFPYIDIDRVGIYGHSGGGFMSTAAMLVYPDFFKVAVSSSGNHENNIYNTWWSERHHGVKETVDKDGAVKFEYSIEKNSELAKNLKGHLLLVTGDQDNNVHPANTLRMADALIKANKRFDFFIVPGKRHGYADAADYFAWIRADYFCRHLIGDSSASVDIVELNREKELKK